MIDFRYAIMELNEVDLRLELAKWDRLKIIAWLEWNDPNGIYNDLNSMAELNNILSPNEGIEIIVKQISA